MEGSKFFIPDSEMTKWISEYSKDRLIFDIGFGTAHFLTCLKRAGKNKLLGTDPFADHRKVQERWHNEFGGMIQILPNKIGDLFIENILSGIKGESVLATLCRPCHSPGLIVEAYNVCKRNNVELLYIGLIRNVREDLEFNGIKYEILNHKGTSEENEVILKLL